jgi:hypothetical protein
MVMKILIINYYFEPFIGAHAYRWSQIAKVWAAEGHEVNVIAGRVNGVRQEVRDGVAVERIGFVKRQAGTHSSTTILPKKVSLLRTATTTLLKKVNRLFFWPDGLWHWLPFLLVSLFKRRHERYDLVVSYSPTFSAHVGGLIYKNLTRNNGQWIADYGDPFSLSVTMPPNNLILYRSVNYWCEKLIVKSASLVSLTNKETQRLYVEKFSAGLENIKCIPHVVDVDGLYASKKCGNAARRFVYVGGFHKGIREPYKMLEFFDVIHKNGVGCVDLHIYGPLNSISIDFSRYSNIYYHGVIGRHEAIKVMKEADFLVNVENENCLMTPSKLVEYIATGNPIINFLSADGCSDLFKFYSDSGYLFNVSGAGDLKEFLGYINSGCGFNSFFGVKSFLRDSDLENVSSEFLAVAENFNE